MKIIKLDNLKLGSELVSIKNNAIFKVQDISDKVTIKAQSNGEIKVLTESTLKRWYRQVTKSVDEEQYENQVQEQQHEEAPVIEDVPATDVEIVKEETNVAPQADAVPQLNEEVKAQSEPPKNKKPAANAQTTDPVLQQLRQRLIDTCIDQLRGSSIKDTKSYIGLRVSKLNYAEVYNGKKRFTIRISSKALSSDQAKLCTLAPASFRWTLDAIFTVLTEEDFDTAMDLLRASYQYKVVGR